MDRLNQERRTAMVRDAVATKGIDAVAGSISGITTGIVMLLAAGQLRSGELSIGDFALFLIWIGFLTSLTRELGAYLTFCRQAAVAFGRMDAMLGSAPSTSLVEHVPMYLNGPPPLASFEAHANVAEFERLDIRDLTCHHVAHDGATSGINGITFTLRRGGLTVITGKIGSGKTTLVRAVLGQLPAEAGTIHWNGTKIDIPQTFMTPPRVGYVPQEPRLFSDTLRNNILLGTQAETNALEHALWEAVFQDDVASFPNQLETEVGSRGLRLSGGQALRAAAARALVRRPELLVIDDLSSALDVDTEHQLWDRLLANPDRTVLAVSHRRQAFQRAHHIIVLRDGRIAAEGSLTELMHSSPDFRAIWQSADSEDKMDGFTPEERTSRAGE
jgi:ATP-binding cassette subfamily B protein